MNLPRNALLSIYKSFFRALLDYGDILYVKPNNETFQSKIERVKKREFWAIIGVIQRTSEEKNYDELCLHSLTRRRWGSKLIFFYKIVNCLLPDYFYSYLHSLRSAVLSKLRPFSSRTITFKNLFFSYCVNEWNNLKACITNVKSLNVSKIFIVSEKEKKSLFWVYDPLSVKLLTSLRLEFDHLNERKFRHGFKDTLNLLCTCGADVKTTEHFLFHFQ